MSVEESVSRRECLREGLAVGFLWAACDWLGAGVLRIPAAMAVLILASGCVAGCISGVIGAIAAQRGVASAVAVSGIVAAQGLAILSRERAHLPWITAIWVLLVAVSCGWFAARIVRRQERVLSSHLLLLLFSIPAASIATHEWGNGWLVWMVSTALPLWMGLAVNRLAGARGDSHRMELRIAALGLALFVAAAVLVLERTVVRPALPDLPRSAPERAPSVALIIVDTLRADAVGKGTPAMNALAAEGVRFEQAISAAPWTLPSHASLFTGLYPAEHGVVGPEHSLSPELLTLAEYLHAYGYQTAAFTGGGFMGTETRLDQGFERFDGDGDLYFPWLSVHVPLIWRVAKNRYVPLRFVLKWVHERGGLAAARGKVSEWLHSRDRARPFLLLVHTYFVHDYFIYHPLDDGVMLPKGTLLERGFGKRLRTEPADIVRSADARDVAFLREVYERRLNATDDALSWLLRELDASVDREDLVVVLTSDHGEGFDAERRRLLHEDRLHDDLVKVPLIVRATGRLPAGQSVPQQVRTIDVLPTLLELVNIQGQYSGEGLSLVSCLEGRADWPALAFFEHGQQSGRRVGVRTNEWKWIENPEGQEAYRLTDDPDEHVNRVSEVPATLPQALSHYRSLPSRASQQQADYSEETLNRLRELGYAAKEPGSD